MTRPTTSKSWRRKYKHIAERGKRESEQNKKITTDQDEEAEKRSFRQRQQEARQKEEDV